jgi:hypothetical protein
MFPQANMSLVNPATSVYKRNPSSKKHSRQVSQLSNYPIVEED